MKSYQSIKLLACLVVLLTLNFKSYSQTPFFNYNGGADVNFCYPPRGSGGRALVHADGNVLGLNFGGDFSGGVRIGNNIQLLNDGMIAIPDGKPFKGSLFETNDYSTMTFSSRAWTTIQGPNGKAYSFQTHNDNGNAMLEMMAIYYGENGKIVMGHNGGNVGIGTTTPKEKLSVNGKIRAHEIKVETANWPDYVFGEDYQLPDLTETELHIKANGHLPGIPSAAEVKNNGIDLGDMNAKLLKKIEELTLHVIELNKTVIKQQSQINKLIKK
jgi:hypothetical protein